jgi:hypothetical protein
MAGKCSYWMLKSDPVGGRVLFKKEHVVPAFSVRAIEKRRIL